MTVLVAIGIGIMVPGMDPFFNPERRPVQIRCRPTFYGNQCLKACTDHLWPIPIGLRRAILTREKAPYRLVILKRRFPASSRKTIVRKLLKCVVLTIVDSHALKTQRKRPIGSGRESNQPRMMIEDQPYKAFVLMRPSARLYGFTQVTAICVTMDVSMVLMSSGFSSSPVSLS